MQNDENIRIRQLETPRRYSMDRRWNDGLKNYLDVLVIETERIVRWKLVHETKVGEQKIDGSGIKICLLDTGIVSHKNLNHAIKTASHIQDVEYDIFDGIDKHGHGTHLAGIIASNDPAYIGVAPSCSLYSIRVLSKKRANDGTHGRFPTITKGLEYVLNYNEDMNNKTKISIVNMSFGEGNLLSDKDYATEGYKMYNIMQKLRSQNVALVVAAGNNFNGADGLAQPAIFRNCIAVGATLDKNAPFYIFGRKIPVKKKELAPTSQRLSGKKEKNKPFYITAPGYKLETTTGIEGPAFYEMSGTSQATAVITGCIALLQQAYLLKMREVSGSNHYALPNLDSLMNLVLDNSESITGIYYPNTTKKASFPQINVKKAVDALLKKTPNL